MSRKQNKNFKPKASSIEELLNEAKSNCPHICDFCYCFSGNGSRPGLRPAHCDRLYNNPFFEVSENDTCDHWSWDQEPFYDKSYFNKPTYRNNCLPKLSQLVPEITSICCGVTFSLFDIEDCTIEQHIMPGYDNLIYRVDYNYYIRHCERDGTFEKCEGSSWLQ